MGRVTTHPPTVLVVGAGLAGARSAAELCTQGFDGRIVVVGAEPRAPYDRPPLSKHLFDRPEPTWLSDELGIDLGSLADEVLLGTAAVALEVLTDDVADGAPARYRVRLDDGRHVDADAVVLATGSVPRVRRGWEDALTLHSPADAARLRAALAPEGSRPPHLICIGAGWIGAEVSGVAAAAGARVTVLEAGPAPLTAAVGPRVGELTRAWYDAVTLETGVIVTEASAREVTLADGRRLRADAVLAAVGARPATDWLGGTVAGLVPLLADGSIAVDEQLRPTDPSGRPVAGLDRVRVVGDCATRASVRHGEVPGGHWDAALRGPQAAVASLLRTLEPDDGPAGPVTETAPDPAPYVFSTQFGRELVLYGRPRADGAGHDDVLLRGDPTEPAGPGYEGWAALWFAPDDGSPGRTLEAVLTVDRPRDVAAARRLFAGERLPRLDPALAADPGVRLATAQIADRAGR